MSASSHPGENVWDALIQELEKKTKDSKEGATMTRFAAHFAILLMLQNRLNNQTIGTYNLIVEKYIY